MNSEKNILENLSLESWWVDRNNEILCDPMGNFKIGRMYDISQRLSGKDVGKEILKNLKQFQELKKALPTLLPLLEKAKISLLKSGVDVDNAEVYTLLSHGIKTMQEMIESNKTN